MNKQKICLLTYADEKYAKLQEQLVSDAYQLDVFDRIFTYGRKDINPIFEMNNREVLGRSRGGGYWLWKPYFLMKAMGELNDNDVILYMDCADAFIMPNAQNINEEIRRHIEDKDMILTVGGFKHSDWTKRDCFVYMNCDNPDYYNRIQLEAGIGVYKKTNTTLAVLNQWLQFCKDPRIITDDENTCGMENLPGFKDHRHDQSILTNIWITRGLYAGSEMRQFIQGNARSL